MRERINKTVDWLNKAYMVTAVIFLVILSICCILQVVSRKFLNGALQGTEELARYAFIWMNMLGASLCVSKGSHATVELLNNALKGKVKLIHSIIVTFAVVVIAVIFVVQGLKMAFLAAGQLSPTIRIDMGIMYLAVVFFGFGALVNGLNNILNYAASCREGSEVAV